MYIEANMKAKEQHVDALQQSKNNKNSNITNKISESFKKLTNSEKLNRINGAVSLLQQFKGINSDEDQVWFVIIFLIDWKQFLGWMSTILCVCFFRLKKSEMFDG